MKKSILSIAAITLFAFATNAQAPTAVNQENPNSPDIVFEKEVMDYGTIEHDANGDREFKFKNTGKEPLIIYSATGSCGCTVPTAPKEPIKPGDSGIIKVHYDTKRVGNFEKTVTVASNAKTPSKTLKIKGNVKPAITPAGTTTTTIAPPTTPQH